MLSVKDVTIVYQTLLSSPGMNDAVKIAFHIPRKNVLLLTKVIETGLSVKDETQINFLNAVNKEWEKELKGVVQEMLDRAGLMEMNDKLQMLETK